MRFFVADTLTGRIVGRLFPTSWTLSDPLRTPGTGELVLPKPAPEDRERLVELTRPRRRWIAAQDEAGAWVWGGPIPRRPVLGESTVTVKVVDWRSWFYRAPLRPSDAAAWRDLIVTNQDQATIAGTLFSRALTNAAVGSTMESGLKVPPMVRDTIDATGVNRDRTFRMLDRSVGEYLDTLVETERGLEWWTYVTTSRTDPKVLEVHTAGAYPERSSRSTPIRLEYRAGKGGNVAETPSWPEGSDAPTRVWAVGDGEPPDQAWAVDEAPDAGVVWEETIGPLDGVKRSATAYEHAYAHLQRGTGFDSHAEFVVTRETLPFADVAPGDRARVIYDDGWESVEVPAARIVERVMSGGRGQPEQQRLVVDLADAFPGSGPDEPGVDGESEAIE